MTSRTGRIPIDPAWWLATPTVQRCGQSARAPVSGARRSRARYIQQDPTKKENVMNIANKTILITGANRGIGQALVTEALRRGAKRVYAGTRSALQHPEKRVTPLTLDV